MSAGTGPFPLIEKIGLRITAYPAAFCQRGFNNFLLLPMQHTIQCNGWTSGDLRRLALEPGLVHGKSITVAQYDGPLNYIL